MKILFVGAGAIGSYLGAFLTRAGQDVTLIDPWAEQVETVRAKGISVSGPHEPFEARPAIYHLHEAQRLSRDFDVAFVAIERRVRAADILADAPDAELDGTVGLLGARCSDAARRTGRPAAVRVRFRAVRDAI